MRFRVNGKIKEKEYGFATRTEGGWEISDAGHAPLNIVIPFSEDAAVLGRDEYRLIGQSDGTAMVIRFSDLHRHSDNSLQDGMTKVKDMVARTEYSGALTDHGNMYGFLEYYKGMNKAGKHPIIGFEGYLENMNGELDGNHVILLAKNDVGYKNLLKLTSESFDHFRTKPHVTWDMLQAYHDGVICLSACLAGIIPSALNDGDKETAEAAIQRFCDIFGKEDFYIEIQRHHIREEDIIRPQLVTLAQKYGLKVVATTDAHYPEEKDREAHDVLLCLQTGKTINDEKRLKYNGDGYFLHNSEQMEELFSEWPEALDNTLEIADKCHVNIKLGDVNLPNYDFPEPYSNADEYMVHIAEEGYHKRFDGTTHADDPEYRERFDYEVKMIKQMGFCAYFIIVWDFINYAKSNNIYVGPGRGSAAGSMVAYCMGITDLDPIKYDLLFERFLNPERISYPDIDTDIEHVGRQKVIQYMIQKYGAPNFARIVTFGTFAAKQAIKDVARVLEMPASYGAKLASMVPGGVGMTIKRALEESIDLRTTYENDQEAHRIIDIAKSIEGGKRHSSQHACGVMVAPKPVSEYLPTSMEVDDETGEKALTSQVIMTEVEELSLIKMDLLGLKNMSVIHEVVDAVVARFGEEEALRQIKSSNSAFRYQDIPHNDRATYQMLRDGVTGGVFQLESPGMTKVIMQMLSDLDSVPDNKLDIMFERLIAAVALYRPGPMDYIPDYINGMKDKQSVHYDCPEEEAILSSTFGVMVYQEQLMQIAQRLAGYSLGQADVLRKACGKKKKEMMDQQHTLFISGNKEAYEAGDAKMLIPGCVGSGISASTAEDIWAKMVKFASYAFNRSHAACYAEIALVTAYMSCHWPAEFYAAMLNAFIEASDKVKVYLAQAERRGIKLLLPDIQKSKCHFSAQGGDILFGLQGIKGLKSMAEAIVEERDENGPYRGMQDMYERLANNRGVKLNKTCMEGLIYSGALRCFSDNKAELLVLFKMVEDNYKDDETNRVLGQYTLFSEAERALIPPRVERFSASHELEKEQETLGMFVSRHPTDDYTELMAKQRKVMSLSDVAETTEPRQGILTLGMVKGIKKFYTKAGKEMLAFSIETKFAELACIVFPDTVPLVIELLAENHVYCFEGALVADNRNEGVMQLSIRNAYLPEQMLPSKDAPEYYEAFISNKQEQTAVLDFIHKHPGNVRVVLNAGGRKYPVNTTVAFTPEVTAFFEQFSQVTQQKN